MKELAKTGLGEPVVHGRPQSVDAGRGGPGDGKLAQEAPDAFNEGVIAGSRATPRRATSVCSS